MPEWHQLYWKCANVYTRVGEMENASSREIIKTRYSLFGFNQNSTKGIKNESPTSVACKLNHSLHPRAFFSADIDACEMKFVLSRLQCCIWC